MSRKIYNVAIAGMGKRGTHYAKAFLNNSRFKIVGLCDKNANKMKTLPNRYRVDKIYTDVTQMLSDTQPNIFVFCTMPDNRLELIKAGVKAGVELIAYEKPMATSFNEALKIRKLLNNAGIKSVVSHQHRYGEHYSKVKELVSDGSIGQIQTIHGHATGWMMHMITHLIDYMLWYNDWIDAEWVVGQAAGKEKFKDSHSSPDYIAGLIQFKNGVRGIVECGEGVPDVPEINYWWHKCRICVKGTKGFAEVMTGNGWRAITHDSDGIISGEGVMNYDHDTMLYIQQIADWLDNNEMVHPCNGDNAFLGFQIAMAICRSVVQRGKIFFPLEPDEPEIEALKTVLS